MGRIFTLGMLIFFPDNLPVIVSRSMFIMSVSFFIPQHRHRDPASVFGIGGGVNLMQVISAFDGIVLRDIRKHSAVLQHLRVNNGDAEVSAVAPMRLMNASFKARVSEPSLRALESMRKPDN